MQCIFVAHLQAHTHNVLRFLFFICIVKCISVCFSMSPWTEKATSWIKHVCFQYTSSFEKWVLHCSTSLFSYLPISWTVLYCTLPLQFLNKNFNHFRSINVMHCELVDLLFSNDFWKRLYFYSSTFFYSGLLLNRVFLYHHWLDPMSVQIKRQAIKLQKTPHPHQPNEKD